MLILCAVLNVTPGTSLDAYINLRQRTQAQPSTFITQTLNGRTGLVGPNPTQLVWPVIGQNNLVLNQRSDGTPLVLTGPIPGSQIVSDALDFLLLNVVGSGVWNAGLEVVDVEMAYLNRVLHGGDIIFQKGDDLVSII